MNQQAIINLKNKWIEYNKTHISDSAEKQFKNFHTWWKGLQDPKLTLKNYTALVTNENNGQFLTNWMERLTAECGRFSGDSRNYGLYHVSQKKVLGLMKFAKNTDPEFDDDQANKYFNEKIYPQLLTVCSKHIEADRSILGINFQRKIAYMFHSGEFLPIFKNQTLENIINFLKIENADSNTLEGSKKIFDHIKSLPDWMEENYETFNENEKFKVTQSLGLFLHDYFKNMDYITENTIFYGPPGTGKTFTVIKSIKSALTLTNGDLNSQLEVIQFHPSYTYEDFIEGYRPKMTGGIVTLELKSGKFKAICKRAADALKEYRKTRTDKNYPLYYFVADEINRAELSRVFGEALVCIEQSKRIDFSKNGEVNDDGLLIQSTLGHDDTVEQAVVFKNGKAYFGVPANIVFIGTMNDTDRSIDTFDLALRRRFVWVRKECEYSVIKDSIRDLSKAKEYADRCENLNKLISEEWRLGESYELGHAYFMLPEGGKLTPAFQVKLFDNRLGPLLREYIRADYPEKDIKKKISEARSIFLKETDIKNPNA